MSGTSLRFGRRVSSSGLDSKFEPLASHRVEPSGECDPAGSVTARAREPCQSLELRLDQRVRRPRSPPDRRVPRRRSVRSRSGGVRQPKRPCSISKAWRRTSLLPAKTMETNCLLRSPEPASSWWLFDPSGTDPQVASARLRVRPIVPGLIHNFRVYLRGWPIRRRRCGWRGPPSEVIHGHDAELRHRPPLALGAGLLDVVPT